VLGGYALIPSLKAIQAMQTGDAAWRRMRAPLVALDDQHHAALARELAPLALDAAAD
jgi:4-hydroxy-tetrahydrodipicolinate synthase